MQKAHCCPAMSDLPADQPRDHLDHRGHGHPSLAGLAVHGSLGENYSAMLLLRPACWSFFTSSGVSTGCPITIAKHAARKVLSSIERSCFLSRSLIAKPGSWY